MRDDASRNVVGGFNEGLIQAGTSEKKRENKQGWELTQTKERHL